MLHVNNANAFMKAFISTILLVFGAKEVIARNNIIDTILVINKQSIRVRAKEIKDDMILLTAKSGTKQLLNDTIDGGLFNVEFPDFNRDGKSDILLTYGGNNNTYFLYLFDQSENRFNDVEDFSNYPDAIQLKSNPKYYYSYHRDGCADMDWASDLFKIENFKAIQLGHIEGKGCDFDVKENPQVIKIYRVPDNDEEKMKLIAKLPYLKFIHDGNKWSFIKSYWNKNYIKFE